MSVSFSKTKLENDLAKRLKKKALQERGTHYNIAAIAFTKKGNFLGISMNSHRNYMSHRYGAGLHAEMVLMKKFGRRIDTIYLLRVGDSGDRLPIHPCKNCALAAYKLGISIIPLQEVL